MMNLPVLDINFFILGNNAPPSVIGNFAMPLPALDALNTVLCYLPLVRVTPQHVGCIKPPRYGAKDEPAAFCQRHKRAGMFGMHDGKLMMATRDGNGEL